MLRRGEPGRCQPKWKCYQPILVCHRLGSAHVGFQTRAGGPWAAGMFWSTVSGNPAKSHTWQSNPVSVNSEWWRIWVCLAGFISSAPVCNRTQGLSTEGAVGPPTPHLPTHLVEAASVEVWSVAAVSRQSPGHCCSPPEPRLAPGARLLLPWAASSVQPPHTCAPSAAPHSFALQSSAASPPLHCPSQALLCWASVTGLSYGRGGHLVGPYLASWSSKFHTPPWRQDRRCLRGKKVFSGVFFLPFLHRSVFNISGSVGISAK